MTLSKRRFTISLILLGFVVLTSWEAAGVSAQTGSWSEPVNISNTSKNSWFPDLAVDASGRIHVVWCESWDEGHDRVAEQVNYATWDGQTWSKPTDIVPITWFIHRPAIAVSSSGDLLMVFRQEVVGGGSFFFTAASAPSAWSAAAWSRPKLTTVHMHNYMADLAVDHQGKVHLLFDDLGEPVDDVCLGGCSDTYYRCSTDNGQTWSVPVNLSRSPLGSSREQLEIDASGTIHVTWDEGWDRLAGGSDPISGVYMSSPDGGLSWSLSTHISYPTKGNVQLTPGADGRGGVMLVWRNVNRDEIFYQWSTDRGAMWSPPGVLPRIYARPWTTPFDMYDMATDSAGHIHLLVIGRERLDRDAPLGVYHFAWDGETWSQPDRLFMGGGYPEYPKIVVSHGNHLHVTWFVRDDLWALSNYEVWYSSSQVDAPYQTPIPPPPPSPTPVPTLAPLPTAKATPYLTPNIENSGLPEGLYTESEEVSRLAVALAPVALVILVAIALKRGWARKRGR